MDENVNFGSILDIQTRLKSEQRTKLNGLIKCLKSEKTFARKLTANFLLVPSTL